MDELRRMFKYNAWANAKIIGSAAHLSTEQAALPIEGIYGSVADTERHMLQVERVYLKLMGADAPEFARGPDEASFTELASAFGSAYDVFLSSLSETALGRRFLVPWFEHEITIRDGLIQVATHSPSTAPTSPRRYRGSVLPRLRWTTSSGSSKRRSRDSVQASVGIRTGYHDQVNDGRPHLPRIPPPTMGRWLFLLLLVLTLTACSSGRKDPARPLGGAGKLTEATSDRKSWAGQDPSPEFPAGLTWFNVDQPLTMHGLGGKLVLLDFWTLGCINCQHIIPDIKRLEAEFGDALVVIGVHSGKYATEHEDDSIREAIRRYDLRHPVVNDPDFAVWKTFGVNAWPTLVLIDPAGNIVGGHAGEGVYSLFQPILAALLQEFDATGSVNRTPPALKLATSVSSTILSFPSKVLADEPGRRLFIADAGHSRILVADFDGRLQQAIGSGEEGFADGAASEATFRQPQGLALSPDGKTLYVADTRNHAIRAVTLTSGEVTTLAGTGRQLDRLPSDNSPARETALASPWDVLADRRRLFISMAGVHQIWALDLDRGTVSVFAGTSREGITDGDRRSMATLAQPAGLAGDGRFLYWVDPESSALRRTALSGDGPVETLVGTGLFDYGDRDGRGKSARFQHAQGVTLDRGHLYVADTYNHKIRAVDLDSREVTTVAGTGERGWRDGSGGTVQFDEPGGVSAAKGRLYVADTNNHVVRVVDTASGEVSTLRLSNLAVATRAGVEGATRVDLPGQAVRPGAATLHVAISAPGGYKLNDQGPSRLSLTSSNPHVVELGESALTWESGARDVAFPVPVILNEGTATVTGLASIYYCRGGEEALCFIHQVEIVVPVTVSPTAGAGEVTLDYALPAMNG